MRKDGKLKQEARKSYTGGTQKVKQLSWGRRVDVEALRDLSKDPATLLDKVVADGLCEKPGHCSHCGRWHH